MEKIKDIANGSSTILNDEKIYYDIKGFDVLAPIRGQIVELKKELIVLEYTNKKCTFFCHIIGEIDQNTLKEKDIVDGVLGKALQDSLKLKITKGKNDKIPQDIQKYFDGTYCEDKSEDSGDSEDSKNPRKDKGTQNSGTETTFTPTYDPYKVAASPFYAIQYGLKKGLKTSGIAISEEIERIKQLMK